MARTCDYPGCTVADETVPCPACRLPDAYSHPACFKRIRLEEAPEVHPEDFQCHKCLCLFKKRAEKFYAFRSESETLTESVRQPTARSAQTEDLSGRYNKEG